MAKEHRGKSEPLFILYRVSLKAQRCLPARSCFRRAPGKKYMDQLKLVVLPQNGALVHRVTGADTPALLQRVAELLVATVDTDSAAPNPIAPARAAIASRTVYDVRCFALAYQHHVYTLPCSGYCNSNTLCAPNRTASACLMELHKP